MVYRINFAGHKTWLMLEQIREATAYIQQSARETPLVGIILGSGLGNLAADITDKVEISYNDIPHFPPATVEGHAGRLILGRLGGRPVVAMAGRFHYYEGLSMQQVTFPVRVMKALGIHTLLISNAAGGMNRQFRVGDLMVITDHINLQPEHPLRGRNVDELGPRFPDMSEPYTKALITRARDIAAAKGISLHSGVYVGVQGPTFETRAEYKYMHIIGGDAVGMSTVPEVIVAVHAGLRVLGFSIVTDLCLPDALEPVQIEKILAVAAQGGDRLARLIPRIIERLV